MIACGAGYDTVYVDRRDMRATRFRDCEMVAPGPPPAPIDPHQGRQRIGGARGRCAGRHRPQRHAARAAPGDDTVQGFAGDDVIWGDHVPGSSGADRVLAGAGNDTIFGNNAPDHLQGDEGDDRISGGRGADILDGGPGNDELRPDTGRDRVFGGDGDDTVHAFGGGKRDYDRLRPGQRHRLHGPRRPRGELRNRAPQVTLP